MSSFTLNPSHPLGIPRGDALRQLSYFLSVFKDADLLENDGIRDQLASARARYRWGSMETTLLADAARRHPDRLGLVDDDGELTYGEFWEDTCRLALGLQARGIGAGDNVAVLARNGRAAILPLTCRHLLGFNIFMINANSSAVQIEELLEFNEIDLFIVDEEFLDRMTGKAWDRTVIVGHCGDDETRPHPELETLAQVIASARVTDELPHRPKRGKHIVMTPGTTGMPKGVIRRTVASPQGLAAVISGIPWERGMTVMLTAVLFHAFGWSNLVMCLLTSSTIIARRNFDAAQALDDIDRYGINAMCTAASRIRALLAQLDHDGVESVPGLKFVISSGSPLTPYEVKQTNKVFGPVLCNFYGSTETTALAVARPEELAADPTLTGTIYPGPHVEIRDDNDEPLPEGEIGRIWAGAYDMFIGYTDEDIEIPTIDGMIAMGDRGYIEDGDKLHVLGRADDLVITQFGEKIFPNELEDCLMRHDAVADVHAHGVTDKRYGQALRVYVIPEEGHSITEDEVRDHVRDNLSDAHVPRDVFFVPDFPRNAMGKVLRRDLPERSTMTPGEDAK